MLVVFVEALLPEVEEGGHLPAFMVPTQEVDRLRERDLDGVEEDDHLNRERTAVHKIPQEEVFGHLYGSPDFQDFEQIIELSNIPKY